MTPTTANFMKPIVGTMLFVNKTFLLMTSIVSAVRLISGDMKHPSIHIAWLDAALHFEENIMFNHIIKLIALALIAGFTVLVAPAANADSGEQAPPKVMINLSLTPAATAELEVKTITTLNTDAQGRVMVGPLQDRHLTLKERKARAIHWLIKDARKCPTVANQPRTQKQIKSIRKTSFVKKGAALKRFKRAVPSAKVTKKLTNGKRKLTVRCYWVKVGGSFTDTGVDPTGNIHGLESKVGDSPQLKRPMLFDTAIETVKEGGKVVRQEISRRRGQNAPGSNVVGVGDCLNPKAKVVTQKRGQYVYSFNFSSLRQHVLGTARQRLHVGGRGRAELGTCWVEFDYDFLTEGDLSFDEVIFAKSKAEAKGKATNLAASINVSRTVEGELRNRLEGDLKVAFGEQCKGGSEPETPKTVIEIDELNDVDLTDPDCEPLPGSTPDEARDQCESYLISTAHATVPSGASGTLRISSNIGTVGFANGTPSNWRDDVKTLNLGSGQHDIKYRFNAPTEGTSATITLTFTPSAGSGAAPDPVKTTVKLNAPPTPPM